MSTFWVYILWIVGGALWLLPGLLLVRKDEWAILNVPWRRRVQTAAITVFYLAIAAPLLLMVLALFHRINWYWIVPYVLVMFFGNASETGVRRSDGFRKLAWWRCCRDYWPVDLRMVEPCSPLNKERACLVGVHPHGPFLPVSMVNFFTEATSITEKFGGAKIYPTTASAIFKIPGFRDVVLALGAISVARKSIERILSTGAGKGVVIWLGGAREASQTSEHYSVLVYTRTGFFKLALQYGVALYPAFTFGENYIYRYLTPKKNTFYYSMNEWLLKRVGYAVPIILGRGIFQKSFGLLPRRHPVTTIVGKPIECEKIDNPTPADIRKCQDIYVSRLKGIFDTYKGQYDPTGSVQGLTVA